MAHCLSVADIVPGGQDRPVGLGGAGGLAGQQRRLLGGGERGAAGRRGGAALAGGPDDLRLERPGAGVDRVGDDHGDVVARGGAQRELDELVDGVARDVLGQDSPLAVGPPGTVGTLVFVAVTVLVVAGCLGLLVLRYRRVSIS